MYKKAGELSLLAVFQIFIFLIPVSVVLWAGVSLRRPRQLPGGHGRHLVHMLQNKMHHIPLVIGKSFFLP